MMSKIAELKIDEHVYKLPIVEGTEKDKGVNITKLREKSGYIVLDPGLGNTGIGTSAITYVDGEKGILRYRGIPIEEMAKKASFGETAYLLIYGELPTVDQMDAFSRMLTRHSLIHEDLKTFCMGYPVTAHPMAILSSMVCNMSSYYPDVKDTQDQEHLNMNIARLLSAIRTVAAFSYKKAIGEPLIYPRHDLSYPDNLLYMMFATPAEPYEINPVLANALRVLLILHADHEQNCSTSTVRLVGSSQSNLFATIAAGILALWGPLHGGANQAVIEMLERIHQDNDNVDKYVERAKNKNSRFRLMGFGHRVYKNFDPRAQIIKKACHDVLDELGIHDPMLEIALKLEEVALKDPFFIERNLYPNVDYYSGIIYRAMGIPIDMFTVMFAIGRLSGWIAHWKEMSDTPGLRIGRPRQIYVGETERHYVHIKKRK